MHETSRLNRSYICLMKKMTLFFAFIACIALFSGCSEDIYSNSVLKEESTFNSALDGTETSETEDIQEIVPLAAIEPDDYLAAAQYSNGLWGYINTEGEWVIAPQYWKAYPFENGLATVKAGATPFEISGWQIINIDNVIVAAFDDGIEVIEPLYPEVYTLPGWRSSGSTIFEDTIIIAKDIDGDNFITSVDKYGLVDTSGAIILEPIYKGIEACREGLIPVDFSETTAEGQGNWGYVDKSGNVIIEPQFGYALPFSDGVARVGSTGSLVTYGCIDTKGQWLFSTATLTVFLSGDFQQGIAPAKVGYSFGLVDKSGATLHNIANSENSQVYIDYSPFGSDSFSEGLYAIFDVSKPNTDDDFFPQGFIDMQGNFAIPAQTEWKTIQGFHGGLCCVFTGSYTAADNLFGYIDRTGKLAIPIIYCKATMFNGGYAAVATGNILHPQYSIIDNQGTVVATMDRILNVSTFSK